MATRKPPVNRIQATPIATQPTPIIAQPPTTTTTTTSDSDSGQITLDGFLITYLGSPLASTAGSSYTLSKAFSSTTKVSVTNGSGIMIKSDIGNFTAGGGAVTFGNSATFNQMNSTQVSNGIVLTRTTSAQSQTPPPGSIGNTLFLGLYRPTVQLSGPPSAVTFKLLKADLEFVLKESSLVADLPVGKLFRPSTTQSFLDQYRPINDPGGTSLVKPRFKLKFSAFLDAGVNQLFNFSKSQAVSSSVTDTSSTSVTIMSTIGFKTPLFQRTFMTGSTLSVQHVQSFETSVTKVISLSTTLNRTTRGVSAVFFDRVFKTFVVVDLGDPGPPTVQGKITDSLGNPIPGAAVTIAQNGTNYIALTNASGAYSLAAPALARFTPGSVQVTSGGVSKTVTIGSGTVTTNLSGVNPTLATSRNFEDTLD